MGPSYELVSGLKAKVDRRLGRSAISERRGDAIWVTRLSHSLSSEIYLEQTADEFEINRLWSKIKNSVRVGTLQILNIELRNQMWCK